MEPAKPLKVEAPLKDVDVVITGVKVVVPDRRVEINSQGTKLTYYESDGITPRFINQEFPDGNFLSTSFLSGVKTSALSWSKDGKSAVQWHYLDGVRIIETIFHADGSMTKQNYTKDGREHLGKPHNYSVESCREITDLLKKALEKTAAQLKDAKALCRKDSVSPK